MYNSSIEHGRIIGAFQRHVPGCYIRDNRATGGYINICRGYRDIPWKDNKTAPKVYRQAVNITLMNLPRGFVTPATQYRGLSLVRPGWRQEFRRASRHLTQVQMRKISMDLKARNIFPKTRRRGAE